MPSSVQLNLPPALVRTADLGASIAGREEVNSIDVPGLLREAVAASGCQHKEAAFSAGYQPDYWTKALNGERGVNLDRLGKLPSSVQCELVTRWGRQLGMHLTTEDTRRRVVANLVKAAAEALAEIA